MIVGALVGLVFAIKAKAVTSDVIMACVTGILGGVGLLFAKDSNVTGGNVSNKLTVPPVTKILILAVLLSGIGLSANTQGLFKPVPLFPTTQTVDRTTHLNVQAISTSQSWFWRFDGAIDLAEINYNTVLKTLVPSGVETIGVGPCIGYQHFVPTSATDPTPINNYGFAGGVLFGDRFKFILQANIWQYLKFGVTVTPHPAVNIFPVAAFVGTGITF